MKHAAMKREPAARLVAGWLKAQPILENTSGEAWRAVARWRDDVRALAVSKPISALPPDASHAELAAGGYNEVLAAVDARVQSGKWNKAQVIGFAEAHCRDGIGMGQGAAYSELARAKPEKDQG